MIIILNVCSHHAILPSQCWQHVACEYSRLFSLPAGFRRLGSMKHVSETFNIQRAGGKG